MNNITWERINKAFIHIFIIYVCKYSNADEQIAATKYLQQIYGEIENKIPDNN